MGGYFYNLLAIFWGLEARFLSLKLTGLRRVTLGHRTRGASRAALAFIIFVARALLIIANVEHIRNNKQRPASLPQYLVQGYVEYPCKHLLSRRILLKNIIYTYSVTNFQQIASHA